MIDFRFHRYIFAVLAFVSLPAFGAAIATPEGAILFKFDSVPSDSLSPPKRDVIVKKPDGTAIMRFVGDGTQWHIYDGATDRPTRKHLGMIGNQSVQKKVNGTLVDIAKCESTAINNWVKLKDVTRTVEKGFVMSTIGIYQSQANRTLLAKHFDAIYPCHSAVVWFLRGELGVAM